MAEQKHKSVKWTFWLVWILASAFGGMMSTVLAVNIYSMMGSTWRGSFVSIGFYSMLSGGVGVMQWLTLRWRIPSASRWVLASTLAGVCAGVIAAIWGNAADLVLGYGGFGALIGSLQWLVLREHTSRAGWWLLANPVGWAMGAIAVRIIDATVVLPIPETASLVIAFGAVAAVAGIVTGIVLTWLVPAHTLGKSNRELPVGV
jgi:hypothetical protein